MHINRTVSTERCPIQQLTSHAFKTPQPIFENLTHETKSKPLERTAMSLQTEETQAVYELATNIGPVNLVLAAALMLFVAYKILSHPSGPGSGLAAVIECCLWLMVGLVGFVEDVCRAVARDLGDLA